MMSMRISQYRVLICRFRFCSLVIILRQLYLFVPSKIPLDTAWALSAENSSAGIGTSITNYSWTITGPENFVLTGQTNIVYFNEVGNYTISLTVTNALGLKIQQLRPHK